MRYLVIIFLSAILIALSSCSKGNCYACVQDSICMECVKGADSTRVCAPSVTFPDSVKRYQALGYTCTINSDIKFEVEVCDDDSSRLQLQHDEYVCNKE